MSETTDPNTPQQPEDPSTDEPQPDQPTPESNPSEQPSQPEQSTPDPQPSADPGAGDDNATPDAPTNGQSGDSDASSETSSSNVATEKVEVPRDNTDTNPVVAVERHTDNVPDGLVEVRQVRADGSAVGHLVVANESPELQQVRATIKDNADMYHSYRHECPSCHVADGVRTGYSWCDSCGANFDTAPYPWPETETVDVSKEPEQAPQ